MAPFFLSPFVSIFGKVQAVGGNSRGWGDHIEWLSLNEGRQRAMRSNVPLMVIVHRSTCGHCINLKRQVSTSDKISEMSRNFAMVNLDSEAHGEVPSTSDFYPDGFYVPRIMFFSPDGSLMRNACCVSPSEYKFAYLSSSDVEKGMMKVLTMYR